MENLFEGNVNGYDVKLKALEAFDDDDPTAKLIIKKDNEIVSVSPVWGKIPEVIDEEQIKNLLEQENL